MRRNISFAVLAAASAFSVMGIGLTSTAAAASQDTYCLQGRQSGYPGRCDFSSYQQCLATASGTAEGCGLNPMKAYAQQRRYHGRYY